MSFKKRVSISAICMILIGASGISFASVESMGYRQFEQAVMESNTDLNLLNIQVEREREEFVKANAVRVALTKYFDVDDQKTYEDIVKINLTPLIEEKSYLDKKFEIIQQSNSISKELKMLYLTYFNLEDDVRSKKDYYEFMDNKASAKEKELELGVITQLDYDTFLKSYKQSFLDYLKAKNAFDMKVKEINIFINQAPETALELTKSVMLQNDPSSIHLDDTMKQIVENSYQIDAIEKEIEIKEMEWTLKQRFKGFGNVAIEMALLQDEIMELKAQLEDIERTLQYDLMSKYNDALIAKEEMNINALDFELAKRKFEIQKLKYDNGLISIVELSESRRTMEAAYYSANAAKLDLYMKVEGLFDFIRENTTIVSAK